MYETANEYNTIQIRMKSIDAVKEDFEDLQKSDCQLMIDLKKRFQIL